MKIFGIKMLAAMSGLCLAAIAPSQAADPATAPPASPAPTTLDGARGTLDKWV